MPIILPIDLKVERNYERYPGFLKFWDAYPRKDGKAKAFKAWLAVGCEPFANELIADVLERNTSHPQWQLRESGDDFRPHASTYVNQHLWTEAIPAPVEVSKVPKTRDDWLRWGDQQGLRAHAGEDWDGYLIRLRSVYRQQDRAVH